MMCSSMNALTRSPISIAFWLGGGSTGMAIISPRLLLRVSILSYLSGADHATHARERREMIVGIAEHGIDHRDALEVVADLVFHRHADAAVELDRLLADEFRRAPDLHLGGADRLAPLRGVRLLRHHGGEH